VVAFHRNCNCNVCRIAGAREERVRTRALASLAISGDGERWTLINASPDLRAQSRIIASSIRAAASAPARLRAVVLTSGESPVCFSRRERSPFTLIATAATLAAGDNPMFDVLGSDVMWRRAITPGEGFSLGGGTNAELFIVPGKVPLYLENDNHEIAKRRQRRRRDFSLRERLVYAPGAASITPAPGA
jgi:pyrroloquinoline quinone biosynthesis protein B